MPLEEFNDKYRGGLTYWSFDKEKGRIDPAKSFVLELPPYSQDLSDAGKGPSYGFGFTNSFCTERYVGGIERGRPPFEAGCSSKDTDFLHLTNWKKAEELVQAGPATSPARSPRKQQARREFLRSAVLATTTVGLSLLGLLPALSGANLRLRPPGALKQQDDEHELMAACIKCGQCVQVCPVEAIHLALFVVSFSFDVQLIEGALTASRVLGFHFADLNSALQVMLAYTHVVLMALSWCFLGRRIHVDTASPHAPHRPGRAESSMYSTMAIFVRDRSRNNSSCLAIKRAGKPASLGYSPSLPPWPSAPWQPAQTSLISAPIIGSAVSKGMSARAAARNLGAGRDWERSRGSLMAGTRKPTPPAINRNGANWKR